MILEIGSRLEAHSAMGGRRLIGKGFLGVDAGLVGCGHLFLYPLLLSLANFPDGLTGHYRIAQFIRFACRLIPTGIDQNSCAHFRSPMDMMVHG
jgi:hypothetical protein